MSNKNTNCKKCKKLFHICCNCGERDWEWNYCSAKCYSFSIEKLKKDFNKILNKIPKEITQELKEFANQNWEECDSLWDELMGFKIDE